MTMSTASQAQQIPREQLLDSYMTVRGESQSICAPLEIEDYCIQTMPDVSPPKWHLAHTTWFFETFVLARFVKNYQVFHPAYDYLFNSYYLTHGQPFPRPQRGLLSRPTVREILTYREAVDAAMQKLLLSLDAQHYRECGFLVMLGLNHEQQHQELIYTDIKHIFSCNPLKPAYLEARPSTVKNTALQSPMRMQSFTGGLIEVGHNGEGFAYDNEGPRHKVWLEDFALATRLLSNGEYLEFINDDGYQRSEFWLSEGWAAKQQQGWRAPLYWEQRDDRWWQFGFHGMQPLDPAAPVCHVSLFEADACARWAGKRLATEFEWEHVASQHVVAGNLREQQALQTRAASTDTEMSQLYGDVWEWTASAYSAYPGYQPAAGSIGEYNGKFMNSQMVLRGGSFATPQDHIRASYRNFFYPADRWQFSGIRFAEDL
jgi:ergothioneine biosynthesis protein EgtB